MNNLNALLKLKAYEQKKSIKELAILTGFDNGYISRIFNNRIQISKDRNIKKMVSVLNLNKNIILQNNIAFEVLFTEYLHTVYILDKKRNYYYEQILNHETILKNTPYYINILLAKMIESIVEPNDNTKIEKIITKLLYIFESLDSAEKNIFITFYVGYLNKNNQFKDISDFINMLDHSEFKDTNLEMMAHYYIAMFAATNNVNQFIHNFEKSKTVCIETKNINRLFNLNILYSRYLRSVGLLEQAINWDLDLLKKLSNDIRRKNVAILFNNVAWTYLLLENYSHAVNYYIKAEEIYQDNDLYFNLAWCYYKLNDNKMALLHLSKAQKCKNSSELYCLLIGWLEAMINKKYSQKAQKILSIIINKYNDRLTIFMKNFIYIQLINHYEAQKDFETALWYSKLVIDNNFKYNSTIIKN